MKSLLIVPLLGLAGLGALGNGVGTQPQAVSQAGNPSDSQIREAFARQGIRISGAEAAGIRANVLLAVREARVHGLGNSKVDFAAVEIAQDLGLNTGPGSSTVRNVVEALGSLIQRSPSPRPIPPPPVAWENYFTDTVNAWNQPGFLSLLHGRGFSPVKISWEDIGRHQNSVWGDRISDVGIWVRRDESDPGSAQLALSVRRDNNFRDKVLMVPSERIKIHVKEGGRTLERTLPERLRELGLTSQARDRNVIVSNQFAIVPVPSWSMRGAGNGRTHRKSATPPRVAFNFSIYPYGSTNFVITDVIEGSSEAIVGPGTHQMLYANIHGQKAPFTASRAEDRQDLLRLEKELKAKGMDVDVQRYYLIQVPLQRDAKVQLSNLGTPPLARAFGYPASASVVGGVASDMVSLAPPTPSPSQTQKSTSMEYKADQKLKEEPGLSKVAIGHGETEGAYFMGARWRGARAEEPIRVTVVYFVTPVGKITEKDMQQFAKAFSAWDSQAIWGGSFVTKETL